MFNVRCSLLTQEQNHVPAEISGDFLFFYTFFLMNNELIEVLQEFIDATEESNQLSGVDFSENEQRIVDRARLLIANVTKQ